MSNSLLGRRTLLIISTSALSNVVSFITLSFITRAIGPESFGTFLYILSILYAINSITDLGFTSAHIKRISEGQNIDDCVSTFIAVKILLTIVMILVVIISTVVWQILIDPTIINIAGAVIALTLCLAINNMIGIASTTFIAEMHSAKSQVLALLEPLVRLAMILMICSRIPTVDGLSLAYLVTGLFVLTSAVYLFRKERFSIRRPILFKSYLSFAAPLAIMNVIIVLAANFDKILIGLSSTSDVAFYGTSQTLVAIVGVVGVATTTLIYPALSGKFSRGDQLGIRQTSFSAERYISMMGMPALILIAVFPVSLSILLFGSQWSMVGSILVLLAIATYVNLINSVYTSLLLAMNRPDLVARIVLLSLLMGLVTMIVLIPQDIFGISLLGLGASGAAAAVLVSSLAAIVVTRISISKEAGMKANPRIALHIFSGLLVAFVLMLLGSLLPLTGFWILLVYVLFAYISFIFVLWLMGEFTKCDFEYALEVVNPKRMWSYIVQELWIRE